MAKNDAQMYSFRNQCEICFFFPFNFSNKHNVCKQSLKKDSDYYEKSRKYENLLQSIAVKNENGNSNKS